MGTAGNYFIHTQIVGMGSCIGVPLQATRVHIRFYPIPSSQRILNIKELKMMKSRYGS